MEKRPYSVWIYERIFQRYWQDARLMAALQTDPSPDLYQALAFYGLDGEPGADPTVPSEISGLIVDPAPRRVSARRAKPPTEMVQRYIDQLGQSEETWQLYFEFADRRLADRRDRYPKGTEPLAQALRLSSLAAPASSQLRSEDRRRTPGDGPSQL